MLCPAHMLGNAFAHVKSLFTDLVVLSHDCAPLLE